MHQKIKERLGKGASLVDVINNKSNNNTNNDESYNNTQVEITCTSTIL